MKKYSLKGVKLAPCLKKKIMPMPVYISNFPLRMFSIFLVVLLDSIGMSLIMPLLGPLILDASTSILSLPASLEVRNLMYGIILSSFSLCMFIGAPLMGDLSDKLGRKPILLACTAGTFLGYGLSAFGAQFQNIILFIVGRCITGFTAGSLPIAQASIIDMSNELNKASNLGIVLFGVAIGYVIGPLLSGFFSDKEISSYFSVFLPLYVVCLLSFITTVLVFFFVHETRPKSPLKINWFLGFLTFWLAFKNKKIRFLSCMFMLIQFSWALYFQYVALFLEKTIFISHAQGVSIFMAAAGLGMAASFFYFIRIISKILKLFPLMILSLIEIIISLVLVTFSHNTWIVWIAGFLSGIGFGIAYPTFISIFSENVSKEMQGLIMGIASTICAFSAFASGVLGAFVADFSFYYPMIFSMGLLSTSVVLYTITSLRDGLSRDKAW